MMNIKAKTRPKVYISFIGDHTGSEILLTAKSNCLQVIVNT